MPIGIEVGLVRLPRGFEQRRRIFQKRHAERVRTGSHRHAHLEMLVDVVVVGLIVLGESGLSLRRFHREQLHAFAVHQELQIVRLVQPLDVLVAVSRQPNVDLVLAVERKGVMNQRAAARPDRQAFEMVLLCEVRRNSNRLAAWRTARTSEGRVADLLRRRDVAIQ